MSPQDFESHYVWTDGHVYDGFGGTSRLDFGDPAAVLTDWRQIDVQNQSGAGNFQWFIDGAEQGSSQTGDGSSWDASPVVGSPSGSGANKGHWLDVFMYDDVLTGTDLTNARTYLADRISGAWVSQGGDG